MAAKKKNKQMFLAGYAVLLIGIAVAATFIDITPDTFQRIVFKTDGNIPSGYAPCEVAFNIDEDYLLNMTFLLPFENRRQEARLKQLMPKIKNTVIEKMDKNRAAMLQNGELGKFKKELLAIINEEMNTSFDTVYFHEINLY